MNRETLDVRPDDKFILDVGSGNNPNPFATVLMERFIEDKSHRGFNPVRTDGKQLVVGDLQYIPFKNKSIDVIVANHVIEHVDDPIKACLEIQRAGKRGYIETPSPFLEQGYYLTTDGRSHWEKHRWYVWNTDQGPRAAERREIGKRLIFQRKDPYYFDNSIHSHIIKQMFYNIREHFSDNQQTNDYVNKLMNFFSPSVHQTVFHWDTSFSVEVRNEKGEVE